MSNVQEIQMRIEELQELKRQCKIKIDVAEALHRLTQNADFKTVFMEEYVKKDSARLVSLLGDASINLGGRKDDHRCDIHERMIGISRFTEYMRLVEATAQQAEKTLEDIHQAESESRE